MKLDAIAHAAVTLLLLPLTIGCRDSLPVEAAAGRSVMAPLELIEIATWELPEGLHPIAAERFGDSSVTVWTVHGEAWVFGIGVSGVRAHGGDRTGLRRPGAREAPSTATLPGGTSRASGGGKDEACRAQDHTRETVEFDRTVVGISSIPGGEHLVIWTNGGFSLCADPEDGAPLGDWGTSWVRKDRDRALVSQADPVAPVLEVTRVWFRWRVREAAGFGFPQSNGGDDQRYWVGNPLLPLDRGFLRVYADIGSPARRIVLYDEHGKVVRFRELDSAIGLFASYPERRELLGMTGTLPRRLVMYRWSWAS